MYNNIKKTMNTKYTMSVSVVKLLKKFIYHFSNNCIYYYIEFTKLKI